MAARKTTEQRFDAEIEYAVSEYGDHQGVRRAKVIRWIGQFPYRARPLAAKVLSSIKYYAHTNIRAMAKRLVETTYAEYSDVDKRHIFFVPIGAPGSGAFEVARHLKTMRDVPGKCVPDMLSLHQTPPDQVQVIVAFDDFSGTGETIKGWWDNNETLIRPKQANLVIGLLVLNCRARPTLEEITEQVFSVDELFSDADVFDDSCEDFTPQEKGALLTHSRRTGCSDEYLRGRGECGLLIAFKHGCPNNSLPILWHEREGTWEHLFRRRAT